MPSVGTLIILAIALILMVTGKIWIGQHLPMPLNPVSFVPGTMPWMNRGILSPTPLRQGGKYI